MEKRILKIFTALLMIIVLPAGAAGAEEAEETITIENPPSFTAVFNAYHGTLSSIRLHEERFTQKEKPVPNGAPSEKFSGRYEMILPWDVIYFPFQFQFKILDGP
ncbi:MAG: hypothetical protein FJ088_05905, partial [Deltaproteobacteria bacterium]|nr:hypothetical protein [Deltaproteobacteria bacterium]